MWRDLPFRVGVEFGERKIEGNYRNSANGHFEITIEKRRASFVTDLSPRYRPKLKGSASFTKSPRAKSTPCGDSALAVLEWHNDLTKFPFIMRSPRINVLRLLCIHKLRDFVHSSVTIFIFFLYLTVNKVDYK